MQKHADPKIVKPRGEALKLGNIKTEFIYKGQSHRSKSLMILCVTLFFFFLLLPGTETYCHVLRLFTAFVTFEYKSSPKAKARKRPGNRTTCSLSQTITHFVNTSSSKPLDEHCQSMPQDALEFLPVDTLNMHAIKSSRHIPSVLAYYQLGTFCIARKRICDSVTVCKFGGARSFQCSVIL